MTEQAMVEICGLTKIYPGHQRPALREVAFSVAPGECFGLLGPNGAGKTTLLSILTRVRKPTHGHVLIDGHDPWKSADKALARVGWVPQDVALYERLTARENLRFFAAMTGIEKDSLELRVETCLEAVALSDAADRRVGTYSGGMKRRVNLAVGLLNDPPLLVLDEPTVGIDPQSREKIFEMVDGLRLAGKTILYTTHYMEEAQRLCSRLVVLDEGEVLAEGTVEEILEGDEDENPCTNLEERFIALTGKRLRD